MPKFKSVEAEMAKAAINDRITSTTSLTGKQLRNDNVFVTSEVKPMSEVIPNYACRKGYEKAIISEGAVVNIVSDSYGHLPNENYFMDIECKLIDAGISFAKRSINKDNRSFAVDYILNDENYIVKVKAGSNAKEDDKIVPMLRFINSYDGSSKTIGYFGMFREVCTNGLTIGNKQIGFKMKHRSDICEVVLPEIENIIEKFFENEFYALSKKFNVMAETKINDLPKFVETVCLATKAFQYAKSEKNPDAGLNAQLVMETINNEATLLNTVPNLWLGYNSVNELIYNKFNKSFELAQTLDNKVFEFVYSLV